MIEHAYGFSGTLAGVLFFGLLVFYIWKESFDKDASTSHGNRNKNRSALV
jgi:hypothetical protein